MSYRGSVRALLYPARLWLSNDTTRIFPRAWEPSNGSEPPARSWRSPSFLRGVLIELLGACLVLLASSYSIAGWGPVSAYMVQEERAAPLARLAPGILVAGCGLMLLGYGLALRATRFERPRLFSLIAFVMLLAIPLVLLISVPAHGEPVSPLPGAGPLRLVGSRSIALVVRAMATTASSLMVYKTLALLSLLLGMLLIWMVLGKFAPETQVYGTWFYAAHPLVLLALAGAGQYDGLLMVLVLGAFLLQTRGWTVLAVLLLGLAALTGWPMLLLFPPYLVWLFAAPGLRRRMACDLGAGIVLLIALVALLYGFGRTSLPALPAELARPPVLDWMHLIRSDRALRWTLLLFATWYLLLLPRARQIRDLPLVWGWSLFAIVSLVSPTFQPWSITWALALGAFVPATLLARSSLVFGFMGLVFILGPTLGTITGMHVKMPFPYPCLPALLYASAEYVWRHVFARGRTTPLKTDRLEQARPR